MAAGLCDLPEEILIQILSYLQVFDVFSTGCVCKTLYEIINLDAVWRPRFKSNNDHLLKLPSSKRDSAELETGRWKKIYFKASYALSFGARSEGKSGERLCAEFVRNPSHSNANVIRFGYDAPVNMSVEIWVKLNRQKPDGIIIGCQSESIRSHRWPQYHWQVMHIGPDGCVRGSLEPYKFMKGPNLNDRCWHHVAITGSTDIQNLIVDGCVVDTINFGIGHEYHRHFLLHNQLGNGVISYGSYTPWNSNAMKPGYCGWYPFHGMVREIRVWSGTLPSHIIKQNMHVQRIDLLQEDQYSEHGCNLIGYWPMNRLASGPWPWQGSLVSCTSHLEEHKVNSSHLEIIQSHLS